ncbi:MAG: hypothetical protein HZA12_03790 [Nitrospirae bacterium]|nr:hypothetical protein [Nitrospirota bacterium]
MGEATANVKSGAEDATKVQIQETYGKLPLYFIQNDGQVDSKVKFYEKASSHATYFTKEGVYITLVRGEKSDDRSKKLEDTSSVIMKDEAPKQSLNPSSSIPPFEKGGPGGISSELIKLTFLNANPNPEIIAADPQDGKVNYFIGNDPEKWRTNIPTYRAVVYKEVYPGIDIKFYGSNRQMEYDIIVKPGADPSQVQLAYDGIKGLRVTENGDLEISLHPHSPAHIPPFLKGGEGGLGEGGLEDKADGDGNKLTQKRPIIYQEIDGKRIVVEGRFKILGNHVIASEARQSPFPSSAEHSPSPGVPIAPPNAMGHGEGGGEGEFAYTFELASYKQGPSPHHRPHLGLLDIPGWKYW